MVFLSIGGCWEVYIGLKGNDNGVKLCRGNIQFMLEIIKHLIPVGCIQYQIFIGQQGIEAFEPFLPGIPTSNSIHCSTHFDLV